MMIGVDPPCGFLVDAKATDEQIAQYVTLCAKDASFASRTRDLRALIARTSKDVPDPLVVPANQPGDMLVATYRLRRFQGGRRTGIRSRDAGHMTVRGRGRHERLLFSSVLSDTMLPKLFVWGEYAAAGILDGSVGGHMLHRLHEAGVCLSRPQASRVARAVATSDGLGSCRWPPARGTLCS